MSRIETVSSCIQRLAHEMLHSHNQEINTVSDTLNMSNVETQTLDLIVDTLGRLKKEMSKSANTDIAGIMQTANSMPHDLEIKTFVKVKDML